MELDAVEREMRDLLGPGERLVWAGRPRQGLVLRPSETVMVPFSLLWGGIALLWEYSTIASGNYHYALFGLFFVAIGLYMVFGRFIFDVVERARTCYGITDQRVIIRTGFPRSATRSLRLRSLGSVTLSEKADASGDIFLGRSGERLMAAGWPPTWLGNKVTPALYLGERSREVYDLLQQARASES